MLCRTMRACTTMPPSTPPAWSACSFIHFGVVIKHQRHRPSESTTSGRPSDLHRTLSMLISILARCSSTSRGSTSRFRLTLHDLAQHVSLTDGRHTTRHWRRSGSDLCSLAPLSAATHLASFSAIWPWHTGRLGTWARPSNRSPTANGRLSMIHCVRALIAASRRFDPGNRHCNAMMADINPKRSGA